jgi:hypothetical protein
MLCGKCDQRYEDAIRKEQRSLGLYGRGQTVDTRMYRQICQHLHIAGSILRLKRE